MNFFTAIFFACFTLILFLIIYFSNTKSKFWKALERTLLIVGTLAAVWAIVVQVSPTPDSTVEQTSTTQNAAVEKEDDVQPTSTKEAAMTIEATFTPSILVTNPAQNTMEDLTPEPVNSSFDPTKSSTLIKFTLASSSDGSSNIPKLILLTDIASSDQGKGVELISILLDPPMINELDYYEFEVPFQFCEIQGFELVLEQESSENWDMYSDFKYLINIEGQIVRSSPEERRISTHSSLISTWDLFSEYKQYCT